MLISYQLGKRSSILFFFVQGYRDIRKYREILQTPFNSEPYKKNTQNVPYKKFGMKKQNQHAKSKTESTLHEEINFLSTDNVKSLPIRIIKIFTFFYVTTKTIRNEPLL